MRLVLVSLLLTGVMEVLPACAQLSNQGGADVTPPDSPRSLFRAAQIIIKFRDPRLDPSQSQVLDEISREVGASLVHVRPMSGGAYVLRPENPVDGAEIDRIIGRLGKRRDVEYVELDRPMRHMREKIQ